MGEAEVQIVNLQEVQRTLTRIAEQAPPKAMAAGIRASLLVGRRAIKGAINGTDASSEMKKAARRTVGMRFKRGGRGRPISAKVGFGVGKASKKKTGGGDSAGVGISKANIHWAVMGTDPRQQDTGLETGEMPPIFTGVVETALSASEGAMIQAAAKKIQEVMAREAQRAAARGR